LLLTPFTHRFGLTHRFGFMQKLLYLNNGGQRVLDWGHTLPLEHGFGYGFVEAGVPEESFLDS